MKRLNDKEYQIELKRIQRDNLYKERNSKLKEEKDKYKKQIKLPSTTKLIAVYLFIILNIVLIYAMVCMWHFGDLSYLGVLITDVAAQILTFVIYCAKSLKENSVGGIVYDMAMLDRNNNEDVSG